MPTKQSVMDPYQLLFPLGFLHALIGASVWILFAFKKIEYPGRIHAHHMFAGFLLSFAAGFLLTAVPRFTGAARCSRTELAIAVALSSISLFISYSVTALAMLLFISFYFARRVASREYPPPPHFVFIPTGLLLGIVGSGLATLAELRWIDARFLLIGHLLLFYGTMLAFLLGVGAKLIAALLGWAPLPTHQIEPLKRSHRSLWTALRKWGIPIAQVLLFLSGFLLEALSHASLGRGVRAFCATWIAVQDWRLYRLPRAPGKHPFWLWTAAWMLLVGLWTHALFPLLNVHAAHLIFIGGFGLITLLIASRVTLAHGGYSLDLESKSRIYALTSVLALLSAITRFVSPWTPSYSHHLAYAALLWILALAAWGMFFLPKMGFHAKKRLR